MQPNLQGVYRAGGTIEVEVLVTTHHKGHFEFAACPIDATQVPMVTATEECFKANKLVFISDESYGAPPDPNYPERAYIAPASKVDYVEPLEGVQPVVGAYYKMKFQLPEGLAGNLVLLQWYYLTANSCKHEGYADYDFPEEWGSDVSLYPGLPDCGEVPPDGNGVPEQVRVDGMSLVLFVYIQLGCKVYSYSNARSFFHPYLYSFGTVLKLESWVQAEVWHH